MCSDTIIWNLLVAIAGHMTQTLHQHTISVHLMEEEGGSEGVSE